MNNLSEINFVKGERMIFINLKMNIMMKFIT